VGSGSIYCSCGVSSLGFSIGDGVGFLGSGGSSGGKDFSSFEKLVSLEEIQNRNTISIQQNALKILKTLLLCHDCNNSAYKYETPAIPSNIITINTAYRTRTQVFIRFAMIQIVLK